MDVVLSLSLLTAACAGEAPLPATDIPPTPVATVRAELVELPSTFEAGGIVRARTTAAIASRLVAPVVSVRVRAGDHVRRGALLIVLEGRETTAARLRAQAVASGSEEGVRAADGSVRAAEAAVALARATHQRVRALHDRRSATPQELDQATAALDGAQAQLDSARASQAAAIASSAAAGAAVEAAAATEAYSTLTAPFDGVITERLVDPGDVATPGRRLLTLEDTGGHQLEVSLDEARAVLASTVQAASVSLGDTDRPEWVDARVTEVGRLDAASHSFLVTLDLPQAATMRSGVFGRARFSGPMRKALVIPASAAVRRGQLTFVYAVSDEGRVRLQPISPGSRTGDRLEVLAGLSEHARVVAAPSASLVEGARIQETAR